jgi:hypothetical protein
MEGVFLTLAPEVIFGSKKRGMTHNTGLGDGRGFYNVQPRPKPIEKTKVEDNNYKPNY